MRRFILAAEKERTKPLEGSPRPASLSPKIQPNLKSSTLYPAEKFMGFKIYERKKSKELVSKDK